MPPPVRPLSLSLSLLLPAGSLPPFPFCFPLPPPSPPTGIGRASSIALFQAGFAVALSGRRQAELDETKRLALEAAGSSDREDELIAVVGDISKEDGVSGLFEQVVAKFGGCRPTGEKERKC